MNNVADVRIETIIEKLQDVTPELKAAGVTHLYVFGSRARGDARPDSDLDVLVETPQRGHAPTFDYFRVLDLVETSTGLHAQISQRELLKPRIAERMADDLIEVF